jgi:hypothetical protein
LILQAKNPVGQTRFLQLDFSKIKYRLATGGMPYLSVLESFDEFGLFFYFEYFCLL